MADIYYEGDMDNYEIKKRKDKTAFPDFQGGAYGRYAMSDINKLLNTFAKGDEGRNMSFEALTSYPSEAVGYDEKYQKDRKIDIDSKGSLKNLQEMIQPKVAVPDNTKQMANDAHGAIDSKISQNNLNPNNIKNQVDSETLDIYGLFEDYMFNRGTAIFNAQTQGGDNRFYRRDFTMPSAYADPSDEGVTKDQIMQLLSNSINQSPDDTVSTQSVQDLYGLHKQPMPKYKKGGKVKNPLTKKEQELQKYWDKEFDARVGSDYKLRALMENPAFIYAMAEYEAKTRKPDYGVKTVPFSNIYTKDRPYPQGVASPYPERTGMGNPYSGHKIR